MANLGELALAGLGLVLVGGYSSKTQAGEGLSALGSGVTSILAAPGTGFGLGLQETAKGFKDLGDVISSWFDWLPSSPTTPGPGGFGSGTLTPDSGDAGTQLLPGGGGNVPGPVYVINPVETEPQGAIVPDNETGLNIDLTKGLGRIYQMNGDSFGFRKAPGLEFGSRKAARTYLKAYDNGVMDGTSL